MIDTKRLCLIYIKERFVLMAAMVWLVGFCGTQTKNTIAHKLAVLHNTLVTGYQSIKYNVLKLPDVQ